MRRVLLSSIIIIIGITFLSRLSYLQIFSFSPDQVLEDPAIKAIYDYLNAGISMTATGSFWLGTIPPMM